LPNTTFTLTPLPPFRLDLTIWVLRRRPHNLVDRWDSRMYRRVLLIEDEPVEEAVTQTGSMESPLLTVEVTHIGPSRELKTMVDLSRG
jgi:DNA-3-methyladenine glycosylase II